MTDLPIDWDKFEKLAQEVERQWQEEAKPLWDRLLAEYPVDWEGP